MNKLKLEHLAPYLPYNIIGIFKPSDVINVSKNKDEERIKESTSDNVKFFLIHCKPILRPLSDLMLFKDELKKINVVFMEGEWHYLDDEQEYALGVDLELWNYNIIEKLLSWHFDVFGLRENDLCIYYNEL